MSTTAKPNPNDEFLEDFPPAPWKVTQIDTRKNRAYIWTDRAYPTEKFIAEVSAPYFGQLEHVANLVTAAPDMLTALKGLFEHCAMVHKHWGDNSNAREADAAIKAAQAAIAKAEGK